MIVDSHCHLNRLDLTEFNGDLNQALDYAMGEGVEHFLTVSVELEDVEELKKIAQHPHVSYSVGWHPTSVMAGDKRDWLLKEGALAKCVAIGETGLDYYHIEDELLRQAQQSLFQQHIDVAKTLKKPLIIHTRMAAKDTIDILKAEKAQECRGVMHCFTEDWAVAKDALELDFMISLSGIVTFKNAHQVHEVAKKTPLNRLLIETDSPYLAPVPHRGKTNHPAWVKHVCETIAMLRGISYQEVAEATTQNFYELFPIKTEA
jgi:TatD DNase family protein